MNWLGYDDNMIRTFWIIRYEKLQDKGFWSDSGIQSEHNVYKRDAELIGWL